MPITVVRSLEKELILKTKDFLLTMQEFFIFSMRAFFTLPKIKRYWRDFLDQATICGTDSIPIVLVSAISIGSLLAIEVGNLLEEFGAKTMLGRSTSISVIRELGPLLMGLMLSARFGSRNGAELGAMKISEQIDALRAFGTDPVAKLVMPRLAAALIMFIPLTALSDFAGLQSAALLAEHYHRLDPGIFWNSVYPRLAPKDFVVGFLKAPVFAIIITLVSSYNGFIAKGGTAGVGRATIKGIVVSSGLVLIANFYVSKIVLENM
ncbi:MAG: ABC transporter permease [Chlorobium sp.]|jgi:phospholipid/cholesterol/gamma-HCH transport system permease protein|uniref:MlaE family ABC transporter permease n=1 Tax=Chlorobium sp. TaxID=1095 RepID=UPI001E15BBC3|nr:ABC transporter permease [Chlorobium sp.]MBN1278562.1 ABC transporter permease [Chlorobiaceae bacterium]MCF8216854.1 ABC transporter permease [Chlorobium sp.]MCF8271699.1 ABC transporter permease [Chlorobium sp.]MCF8288071.1 ABC transporter permease [Chlorobium sp.]MCF8291655.1 ABC transporter permease [Chlorobium sp.]